MIKLRNYEIAVIIKSELNDEQRSSLKDVIQDWVVSSGGEVVLLDEIGKRKLAYPIEKQREGYYVFWYVKMSTAGPAEVERQLSIHEDILRYMIIRSESPVSVSSSQENDSDTDVSESDSPEDSDSSDQPDIEKIVDELMEKEEMEGSK